MKIINGQLQKLNENEAFKEFDENDGQSII